MHITKKTSLLHTSNLRPRYEAPASLKAGSGRDAAPTADATTLSTTELRRIVLDLIG